MNLKLLLVMCLVFVSWTSFAQNDSIKGTLIDSATKEPIPFENVLLSNGNGTTTDIDGNFKIKADTFSFLEIESPWYETKIIKKSSLEKPIIIKLKKTYEKMFEITEIPKDTTYYPDKKIEQIKYGWGGGTVVSFYESGRVKKKEVGRNYREYYENGKLKYQCIELNSEAREKTQWYDNGQMKAHGTIYFAYSDSLKRGTWFNNKDWQYWDKDGKEIRKQ